MTHLLAWWSLRSLSGCSPFSAEEEEDLLQQVAKAQYEFHEAEWKNISAEAKGNPTLSAPI